MFFKVGTAKSGVPANSIFIVGSLFNDLQGYALEM
jgi:hypothetical protein